MQETPHVLGFTSGELSPWLSSRFDLQAYQRGAAKLSNFLVMPYGGIRRRRGTKLVEVVGYTNADQVRLFPFVYSEGDALMLEFGPGYMHVYHNAVLLLTEEGVVYHLDTPWESTEELASLRFTQINDVVYVCCPTHPPIRLVRHSNTSWSCEEPELQPYPRATYNTQHNFLSVSMSPDGKTAYLTLPEDAEMSFKQEMEFHEYILADVEIPTKTLFRNQSINSNAKSCPNLKTQSVPAGTEIYVMNNEWYFFYYCVRDYNPSNFNGSTNPEDYPHHFMPGYMRLYNGAPYEVNSDWALYTTGEWNMMWELWRSYDTPDSEPNFYLWEWERIKTFEQSDNTARQNWALSGSEPRPCRMALVWKSGKSTTSGAVMYMNLLGGKREYKLFITQVYNEHRAQARVLNNYLDGSLNFSTRSWSFGAMGALNGYPSFSSLWQGRLWFGGMPGLPTTLLGSCTDDYHNFFTGSAASDALHLTLASDDQSRITWMCPTRQLLLGTTESEWALNSTDGRVMTASNAAYTRQSSVGSESMPALAVENTVLFVQRGGKRLREISYKLEADGFTSIDLSLLAEHLPAAGVREWCVQRGSNFYVWLLMKDGSLAVLTLNLEQQVTAWQRIELPGREVTRISAMPGASGEDDDVWFVTRNLSSGQVQIERISADAPFIDMQRQSESPQQESFPEFAGCAVILQHEDGEQQRAKFNAEGVLELEKLRAGTWSIGIPYASELETLPLESVNSYNSVRELSRVRLRLSESDPNFYYKSTATERWEQYTPTGGLQDSPFTGSIRLAQMPDAGVGQGFSLRYDGDADFRLLALTIEVDHHGK